MQLETILASLESIPRVAILLFVVLGVVLIVEVWYLRPKRKLPPIPKTEEEAAILPPRPRPTRFLLLKQKPMLLVVFLLILAAIIPLGTLLLKQSWEAKKRIIVLPSLPPTTIPLPKLEETPKPISLPSPVPELTASPSATPKELAWALPTSIPTTSPIASAKPTRSPEPPGKGAPTTPSPSPTLPTVKKPEELPEAAVSEQLVLLTFLSLSVLSVGIVTLRKAGPGTSEKKQ